MKYIHLLINSSILLIILGFAYFLYADFGQIKSYLTPTYYKYLAPKAGALQYEKDYKITFNKAEKVRLKTNKLVDESKKGQGFDDEFKIQMTDAFTERELYLNELIAIDKKSADLKLPAEYKEFYEKRLEADINEKEAFLDYKEAMQNLSKSSVIFTFQYHYKTIMDFLTSEGPRTMTVDNEYILDVGLSKAESQFNEEVLPLIENEFFTEELGNDLKEQLILIRLTTNLHKARLHGDTELQSKYYQDMIKLVENTNKKSSPQIYLEWSNIKVQPYMYSQDKKHKASFKIYNEAYKQAKNDKLTEITNAWNGDYPGTVEDTIENPSYLL